MRDLGNSSRRSPPRGGADCRRSVGQLAVELVLAVSRAVGKFRAGRRPPGRRNRPTADAGQTMCREDGVDLSEQRRLGQLTRPGIEHVVSAAARQQTATPPAHRRGNARSAGVSRSRRLPTTRSAKVLGSVTCRSRRGHQGMPRRRGVLDGEIDPAPSISINTARLAALVE